MLKHTKNCCKLVGYVKTTDTEPNNWPIYKCNKNGLYVREIGIISSDGNDYTFIVNKTLLISNLGRDDRNLKVRMFWNTLYDAYLEHSERD